MFPGSPQYSPASHRVDFSSFINSMDESSFAYFSLVREYASRSLQGYALHYQGLYKALVSQKQEDESLSRISVVQFMNDGSRSKTLRNYEEFKSYLDGQSPDRQPNTRRLFILEDLPVRFMCLLGSRLRIHPTVFARHYSTDDNSSVSDNLTSFPSKTKINTTDGLEYESECENEEEPKEVGRRFTLRYRTIMPPVPSKQHPNPSLCPPWFKPSEHFTDQSAYPSFAVERVLYTPTKFDKWDSRGAIAELDSQVTYWSQMCEGGGWNGGCPFHTIGSAHACCI